MIDDAGEAAGVWAAVLGLSAAVLASRLLHLGEAFAVVAVAVCALAYGLWWWFA